MNGLALIAVGMICLTALMIAGLWASDRRDMREHVSSLTEAERRADAIGKITGAGR